MELFVWVQFQKEPTYLKAFINNDSTEIYSREWRGALIEENLYDRVARESYNIKEKTKPYHT